VSAAVWADGDLGIRELLDFFCVLVALSAFVFVEGHCGSGSCLSSYFLVYSLL
jgi:hypothetical protein